MEFDPRFPKWEQIAEVIRERIASGEYGPRALISEVRMEQEFGTSRPTIRKVTRALREEGLITTHPGMGSFVTDNPAAADGDSDSGDTTKQ
ncbi:winged helix-turn-helix domain-containing protein [Streptomyces sp. XM4193]|uniref:GntR family transcriptional regulator n=1 Tax=Streptomyces sp. XM4193 TaxID=2929782 RepID=UPI0024A792A9|nr:winged helix-turn-helix domain-containing protein [Streptomyces sp. XM4193]